MPVPRVISGVSRCHSMFKRIRDDGQAQSLARPPDAGLMATLSKRLQHGLAPSGRWTLVGLSPPVASPRGT